MQDFALLEALDAKRDDSEKSERPNALKLPKRIASRLDKPSQRLWNENILLLSSVV
jgi:hypothetical protein